VTSAPRPRLTATYRVQMNHSFTFAHARAQIDYLARLGISHLYCSPIVAARKGSMHGYDVVDPTRVNPELGTEADLRALSEDLHAREMGLIVDIVPNHMGIGAENAYWDDVLTHGERSRYARWFDIEWTGSDGRHRKLVLPILGDELERVLERGELSLQISPSQAPRVTYFSHRFPIDPATLPPELQLAQVDPEEAGELAGLYSGAEGRERLRELLDVQHYELMSWRRGAGEVNYRRFFDVNDLVGIRVEDPEVFEQTHAFVLKLVREGIVDGLRVDHIDGLLDPAAYLERLRAALPRDTPIFVEKILSPGEELRSSWPVQGTTGYEFLNALEDAFIDPTGFADIVRWYHKLRRLGSTTFPEIAHAGKTAILNGPLRADVERLAGRLAALARTQGARWPLADLSTALIEFIAALPVYRTYIDPRSPIHDLDRAIVMKAASDAQARNARLDAPIGLIADACTGALPATDESARLEFVQRLQQVTGPATAKGVEDTALYVYVPLVSRNEVGGAPESTPEDAVERLHHMNARHAEYWPLGLLATNTHDTKRSADIRARLEPLSEVPLEWERAVRRWRRLNAKHRRTIGGRLTPDTNMEYLLYQTIVALWPPPRPSRRVDDLPDRRWRESARERLTQYMLKAAREAKTRTSWGEPNAAYERALGDFVGAVLEPSEDAPFLPDVARLVSRIAPIAAWNALSRVAIHLTAPGTPDLYQGDEFWNYTLVDPDNRRSIDYDARSSALGELASFEEHLHTGGPIDLFDNRMKLLVVKRLLETRRTHPELFMNGAYRPLSATGARARHVIAFAREGDGRCAITVVPRLVSTLVGENPEKWWGDTTLALPAELRQRPMHSQLLPGEIDAHEPLRIATLFAALPVVVAVG
jgi:(1->4)-alpha-D-glucan 1-alpha-D-glucosylmutase